MNARNALMTHAERAAYLRFLAACEERIASDFAHLARLRRHVERAVVVGGASIPADRASLHSQVLVRDLVSGRTHVETVALPADAQVATGRRALHSWSAPLLLGAREGDEVSWAWGDALKQWRIEKILRQPTTKTLSAVAWLPAQHGGGRNEALHNVRSVRSTAEKSVESDRKDLARVLNDRHNRRVLDLAFD